MLYIRSKKGFTLVEVMIVAAIMSLLASLVVYAYSNVRESAQTNICAANQKTIYEAAVLYDLNEPDSLKDKSQKGRLDALVEKGYIKNNKGFECPASTLLDNDDYIMVFDGNYITDVNCETRAEEHVWP